MKKVRVLTDIRAVLEFPGLFRYMEHVTGEYKARRLEEAARDLESFIRDHRSQDPVSITIERVYEDQCSGCHNTCECYNEGEKEYCAHCGKEVTT